LKRYKVETLCTSDDLLANLEIHKQVQEIEVLPSLRGDALLQVEAEGYLEMMNRLSEMTGINIASWDDCKTALSRRLDDFGQAGCVLADHSLDDGFDFVFASEAHAGRLFKSILAGEKPEPLEAMQIKTALLFFLAGEYAKRGWVMQLHLGALRQTSSRLRKLAGTAGGYAGIGSPPSIATLVRFMDELEQQCLLPKTILYTLNPSYNEQLAVLTGSFSEDHVPGKIQLGPAWWFNDHFAGIRQHLQVLANYSLLSRFIGMTTDSRTVLSFSRHEYFRRILCNMLGEWVEQKLIPEDYSLLRELVEQISCKNIRNYLNKGK
jgi:glucuronate isomerase